MGSANTPKIQLLLNHADDDSPILADGLPEAAIGEPTIASEELAPLSFYDGGAAGNDLEQQGWGMINDNGRCVVPLMRRGQLLLAAAVCPTGASLDARDDATRLQ